MSPGVWNQFTGCRRRKLIRLKGYDYSQPGYYFITIGVFDYRRMIFGNIRNCKMELNDIGRIADEHMIKIPDRFPGVAIDKYQIMPNHIHVIFQILGRPAERPTARPTARVGRTEEGAGAGIYNHSDDESLQLESDTDEDAIMNDNITIIMGDIVGAYKSLVFNECLEYFKSKKQHMGKLWHWRSYDRIIRDEVSLNNVRRYIEENPKKWDGLGHP